VLREAGVEVSQAEAWELLSLFDHVHDASACRPQLRRVSKCWLIVVGLHDLVVSHQFLAVVISAHVVA